MRVGFLLSGSLDSLTGGYIYDRQLVEHLRSHGHQVEIFNISGNSYFNRLLQSPRVWLSDELKNFSPNVLLEDELDHPALILFNRRLKSRCNFPVISIVHNLHCCELRAPWQNRIYRHFEKHYLAGVDGFIFNSYTTRHAVESLLNSVRPCVVAFPCGDRLPNAILESEIIDRALTPGPLRILFLGNVLRNKGLHVLLDALDRIPGNSFFLTVVGSLNMEKSYVRDIKSRIQKYNLNSRVAVTGPLNNQELTNIIKQSHVMSVPSFYEGYGIAYLEGMGFGLPAIGTHAGAASEIITHGWNGFLIHSGDSLALSGYLLDLHRNREKLVSMSLNALHRFSLHPTWKMTCGKIQDFLLSMI